MSEPALWVTVVLLLSLTVGSCRFLLGAKFVRAIGLTARWISRRPRAGSERDTVGGGAPFAADDSDERLVPRLTPLPDRLSFDT